jgi:outer membrane protein OmpA-like peptidoglycan-associated protein
MPMKTMAALVLALAWGLESAGNDVQEQGPGLPPGAKSQVLDLKFPVEDLGGGKVDGFAVKETRTEVRIEMAADVLFEFDKATLRPDAAGTLEKAAEFIRTRSVSRVRIEGHTDGKGAAAYNQRLSERRAEAVRAWMTEQGLSGVTFTAHGFGATRPAAPNTRPDGADDPIGRQKNRRVEIVIPTNR